MTLIFSRRLVLVFGILLPLVETRVWLAAAGASILAMAGSLRHARQV